MLNKNKIYSNASTNTNLCNISNKNNAKRKFLKVSKGPNLKRKRLYKGNKFINIFFFDFPKI